MAGPASAARSGPGSSESVTAPPRFPTARAGSSTAIATSRASRRTSVMAPTITIAPTISGVSCRLMAMKMRFPSPPCTPNMYSRMTSPVRKYGTLTTSRLRTGSSAARALCRSRMARSGEALGAGGEDEILFPSVEHGRFGHEEYLSVGEQHEPADQEDHRGGDVERLGAEVGQSPSNDRSDCQDRRRDSRGHPGDRSNARMTTTQYQHHHHQGHRDQQHPPQNLRWGKRLVQALDGRRSWPNRLPGARNSRPASFNSVRSRSA